MKSQHTAPSRPGRRGPGLSAFPLALPLALSLGLILAPMLMATPRTATAAPVTVCTASSDSFGFGSLSLTSSSQLTGSVYINCTTQFIAVTLTVQVRYCLSFGSGTGGAGAQLSPRWMAGPNSETLQFDLARDAAHTMNLGSLNTPSTQPVTGSIAYLSILGLIGSGFDKVDYFARVPAQPMAAVGSYSSSFGGSHTELSYRYSDLLLAAAPTSCTTGGTGGASGVRFPFAVTGNIDPECHVVAATDMDFGNVPGVISSAVTATSQISLTCRRNTAWQMSLSDGQNASAGSRRMAAGGRHVNYELYRDAAMTERFGQTENVDRLVGSGTGNTQTVNVYGRIPAAQSVPVGNYTDRVIVTVTY